MPEGNLHEYAVNAEENLEKLATGLAQAGADPGTVETIEKMADMTRKVVKALGKGQEGTGDEQPPEPQPEQPQRPTMASATDALHRDTQAAAAQRQ